MCHCYVPICCRTLRVTLMPQVYFIFTPSENCGSFSPLSLLLMSKSNKLLSLEMWFPIQRAGYRVDSSLIRKSLHECSCTSQPLSPSVIIIAASHEKEAGEIPLKPYSQLHCHHCAMCSSDENKNQ